MKNKCNRKFRCNNGKKVTSTLPSVQGCPLEDKKKLCLFQITSAAQP